ncbi:MAG: site-specific integrase [Cloacibacillus sp.]
MTNTKLPTGIRYRGGAYRWEAAVNKKRINGSAATLQEAVADRENAINRLKTHVNIAEEIDECPTLKQAITKMLATDWAGMKSIRTIQINCNIVQEYFGADTKLYEITTKKIDDFTEHMRANGSKGGTINRKLSILSKILKKANRKDMLTKMPAIDRERETGQRIRFITPEEEDAIITQLKAWDKTRAAAVVKLLVETGIRAGELFKLKKEDILADQAVNGCIYLKDTKNGESRVVPLTKSAREAFDYLSQTSESPEYIMFEDSPWLTKIWNRVRNKLGYRNDKNFVPHILRHTCCSRLVQRGAPIKKVQLFLGHKSINTTMKYAHLCPDDIYDLTALLEK